VPAMRTFQEAWGAVANVDGWLTEGQARMLYEAAAGAPNGSAIVEIGSHHGRSTVILGSAAGAGVQLVAVDPFEDVRWGGGTPALDVFRENLAGNGLDSVTLMRAYGAAAGREWQGPPVSVLFVDGAHDYESVCADLRAWLPHLSESATVLMHDAYSSPGVTRAAFRVMFTSPDFSYAGASRSLVRFQRGHGSSLAGRAGMVAKLPWFARNLLVKVASRRGWTPLVRLLGHTQEGFPY
jgi:predicted O-methyltransferase YrrM